MADVPVQASVCGTVPNFIGHGLGGMETGNRNASRKTEALQGIWMTSENVPESLELWGTMALVTSSQETATYRTAWREEQGWGEGMLDSWDDQGTDGHLHEREGGEGYPIGSLCVSFGLGAGESREVTFILVWHYPNRQTWTPCASDDCSSGANTGNTIGNHYAVRFWDAWHAAEELTCQLPKLEKRILLCARLLRERPAVCGQGSGAVQPEHTAQPDLLSHA